MRVVITGGAGHMGKYVGDELRAYGYTVVVADQRRPEWGGSCRLLDFRNLGEVYGALDGADAVVHLAAIPSSGTYPNEFVFANNVLSTHNIFEAASRLGIPRVVQASSFTVLGFSRWVKRFCPTYVPIDEQHPNAPQEAYGLSKLVGEDISQMYAISNDMTTIDLRFCPVVYPELPTSTYAARLRTYWQDPAAGAEKLWSYIDVRDVATIFRLALEANNIRHDKFYVSARNTHQRESTRELIARHFPQCGPIATDFGKDDPCESIVSTAHAGEVLGFVPAHRWEAYYSV